MISQILPVECFYTAFQQNRLIYASRTAGIEYRLILCLVPCCTSIVTLYC